MPVKTNLFKIFLFVVSCHVQLAFGQTATKPYLASLTPQQEVRHAEPLQPLIIVGSPPKSKIEVKDGGGRVYFNCDGGTSVRFVVGGSLGRHVVTINSGKGRVTHLAFDVDVTTKISDGGHYDDMFDLLYTSMQTDTGSVVWNGDRHRYFVPWMLDHCHTMKGLKYFYDFGSEFVDLMRKTQRADGMIYSFVQYQDNVDYWRTRDALSGYTQKIGGKYFIRQPTENHPEYIFVKTIYQCWKASGDDKWMTGTLEAAAKALDYAMHDRARWSERFQLLKRVYTIDSWDFQVDDEYTPDLGMTNTMIIDPDKSKFGIFFGDNTGYIQACKQLAEMLDASGKKAEAQRFRDRAREVEERLDKLAWNGKFYTHFIDEDPAVKRNLGVDERSQIAQSNAYSVNRGIGHEKSKAIIDTYLSLKQNLPVGSPGEWYAIYPPFERGFDIHGAKWQYMNGGVGGHVAGELARGAFEHGYESYGVDILERLYALGKKYNNKIYFSYTGSFPPAPPPPAYKPVDLRPHANMNTWITEHKNTIPWMNSRRAGDDLRNMPVGRQTFSGIDFQVIDPQSNERKAAVAVSRQPGFPVEKVIPVNEKAEAIYLLHTSGKPSSEGIAGAVSFQYTDGTSALQYLVMEKHLTYWWFSQLKNDYAGIAWYGENEVSKGIGVSWCAINNPHPQKTISQLVLHAPQGQSIYTLLALTLSDQKHYVPVPGPSYGGPDNWAAATAMAALIEGLAGVKNTEGSVAMQTPLVAPRWSHTHTDSIYVAVHFPASDGYTAYRYQHDRINKRIVIDLATGGSAIHCRIPLPEKNANVADVQVNGKAVQHQRETIESTSYVTFVVPTNGVTQIALQYNE